MLLILGAAVATDWQTLQEKYAEQPFPSPHKVNAEGEAPWPDESHSLAFFRSSPADLQ